MKNTYLVVVEEEFVRDAQVALTIDADPMDAGDGWGDAQAELVIGTYQADNEKQAIENACSKNVNLVPETLTTYLLAANQPKG